MACPTFVLGVWVLMLLAALALVGSYGSNVPSWDGWDMVPTLTGEQPISLSWLWSQHNEHRIPLPRLILLGLGQLTNNDFRAGMYLGVLTLGALALAMILVVKQLRGAWSYSDAFFPLILLNWGHAVNMLWGWQVQFFASTVLAGIILLAIAKWDDQSKGGQALIVGMCLLLLPLCGANGLGLVPALALWLGYSAVVYLRSEHFSAKWKNILILCMALAALLLILIYFIGYEKVPYHLSNNDLITILGASLRFLTIGLGPVVTTLWPFSGFGLVLLLIVSLGFLFRSARHQPQGRVQALGFFFFLGSMCSLALGIGLGREGFEIRYITLAAPVFCCVYFIYEIYSRGKFNTYSRATLFALASFALWPNTHLGIEYANTLRHNLESFEQDMEAGVPAYMLINRYGPYLHNHHDLLIDYMPMLRRAGVGQFRFLKDNPPFLEIPVPLAPISSDQVKWKDTTAYVTGNEPYLTFGLDKSRYVAGIRLTYSHKSTDGILPFIGISWKAEGQKDFPEDQLYGYSPTGDRVNWERGTSSRTSGGQHQITAWPNDTMDQLVIIPDLKPGVFKIFEIMLLIPDTQKK